MKMIINIPDYRYDQCQKDITTLDLFEELVVAVKNGTPLFAEEVEDGKNSVDD